MRATLLSRSRWGWWRGQDLATLARMRRRYRTINRSGSPSCVAGVPNG